MFEPWVEKIHWKRESVQFSRSVVSDSATPWTPAHYGLQHGKGNGYPLFLPGEFHGQRRLEGYSLWGHKESDVTEQLTFSLFHSEK